MPRTETNERSNVLLNTIRRYIGRENMTDLAGLGLDRCLGNSHLRHKQ
jgi:hypothetical protein